MIAEHQFITTLEKEDVISISSGLLDRQDFRMEQKPDGLYASKGRKQPAKARSDDQLPQVLDLRYDRGRCNIAASILPYRKSVDLHRRMLVVRLEMLESLLVSGMSLDDVMEKWVPIQAEVDRRARKQKAIRAVMWSFVAAVFLGLIGIIIWAATS